MPVSEPRRLALFEQGFRPFFLGAALFAGIALPAWLVSFSHGATWPSHLAPRDWHVHEMVFGYFGAVLGGFILTAIPNWTDRLPVTGVRLAALSGLWLAGRVAMAVSAGWPVAAAAIDASYLVALAAVAWRELVASRNVENMPICVLIGIVALANVGFHASVLCGGDIGVFERMALGVAAMLIGLIGGRIVPSFTRNWLEKRGETALPASFGPFDKVSLAVSAAAILFGSRCLPRPKQACCLRKPRCCMRYASGAGVSGALSANRSSLLCTSDRYGLRCGSLCKPYPCCCRTRSTLRRRCTR